MADGRVTLTINVDLSGWAKSMAAVAFSAFASVTAVNQAAAAEMAELRAEAMRWSTVDETSPWARRRRRYRTHVVETPRESRMHAAYRAKTRRRNRR